MASKITLTIITALFALSLHSFAQDKTKTTVGTTYDNMFWHLFAEQVEKDLDVRLFFYPDSIPQFRMSVPEDDMLLEQVLKNNFRAINFEVSADNAGNYFIYRDKEFDTRLPYDYFRQSTAASPAEESEENTTGEDTRYLNTQDDYITKKVTIGSKRKGFSTNRAVLSGYVTSSENNNPVAQAVMRIEETDDYTTTNDTGYYKMILPKGKYTLAVSSMASHEKKYKLQVYSSGHLNISLDTKTYMLQEAVITSNQHHNVRGNQMGFEKIRPKSIKDIPVIFGEQDITKVATMLPGVQTIGEAASGFNVRGSPADQNIFFLNEIPIYNVTHLFGFFSAFNSDAVNEFSLYKSNIPIKYGGRLSSIFDVEAKKGNSSKFSARGGISPITGRIMAEGPIKENKSSYLIGVRSTYSDWVLNQINDLEIKNSNASFADAITNLSFNPDKNNNIEFLAYGSRDNSDLALGSKNKYSNAGGSLSWEHRFNEKIKAKLSLIHSDYSFSEEMSEAEYSAYERSFRLQQSQVRLHFNHPISENHTLNYGYDGSLYHLSQGDFLPLTEESVVQPLSFEPEKALENNLYLGDDWEISKKFSLSGGLRLSIYNYLGPKTVYQYADNLPREEENISDTTHFGANESIADYTNLDYRIGAMYMVNDELSVKFSYNKLHQYMFLLSNTISISPTDKWKLADKYIEPMSGQQYSAGVYKNLLGNSIETSMEVYYKKVNNLVEYEDGADFLKTAIPEAEVIQGDLKAYGIELMVKKPRGKISGWINYTYSNSTVTAIDEETGESNNFGLSYPANYDKPHALNISVSYRLSKRFSMSSNLVYSTGRPITYPTSIYYQDGMQITGFSQRNEYRLPDYFRMDFSMNFEGNLKKEKLLHGSWSLSAYNITARRNAYSAYFKNVNGNIQGYKLSIFGTIIPSISYNFKIGNYND